MPPRSGSASSIRLLAEGPDVSAATVVHDVTVGDYTDPETVRAFAAGCDVVTFDHEHVPNGLLRELEAASVVASDPVRRRWCTPRTRR